MHLPRPGHQVQALTKYMRSLRPAAVNFHYGGNHLSFKDMLAAKMARVPRRIATIQHATPIEDPRKRKLTALAARLAHEIIVPSESTKHVLMDAGVSASIINVIPIGVADCPPTLNRDECRKALGVTDDEFVISSLARLTPEKGFAELIRAVASLDLDKPKTTLLIAGAGAFREELEKMAAELAPGRIRFLGRVPESNAIYTASDLFALPSFEEGFGVVFAEAAMCGVASVAAAVGGVPEVVDDGRTGLLVQPGDVEALANAIDTLRTNRPRLAEMCTAAKERAESRFSERAMAEGYAEALFRNLRPQKERRRVAL
jgi:glycosyltransferase involved in cell wall biosynthesis